MNNDKKTKESRVAEDAQPDTPITDRPDENVDQDGHCITPAYAEAVGPNTGEPCDDGRAGGK